MHTTLPSPPPVRIASHAAAAEPVATAFVPHAPESLEASGLSATALEEHVLRCVYAQPQVSGAQLAAACGLSFQAVIGPVINNLRQDHLLEVRGQRGIGEAGYAYVLTSKGTTRALEALERTLYRGPLPVPIADYIASVEAQRIDSQLVTSERVREAFSDLLVPDSLRDKIGPSIMSGSALFLFGAPGNGKTAMAERISRVLSDPIYIPHALEVDGTVVKLFDPLVHRPLQAGSTPGVDQRWVRIERPLVTAGGELTLAGLDFGRQRVQPVDLLNRWIVPLEKQVDYLTLVTGQRVKVPFQQMLVFATNLEPGNLADEAFLRRIRFKMRLDDPTRQQFEELFFRECASRGMTLSADDMQYMLQRWWTDRPLRMCQPRDVVHQIAAIAQYRGARPDAVSRFLLDEACASYFAA